MLVELTGSESEFKTIDDKSKFSNFLNTRDLIFSSRAR